MTDITFTQVDGPIDGITLVTVTAYWSVVQSAANITATIGQASAYLDTFVTSTLQGTKVVLRVPPAELPGIVTGVLMGSGDMRTEFQFEYFRHPEITRIEPRVAALDGKVPDCPACIMHNDGTTVSIWVTNFPRVSRIEDIGVAFDAVVCGTGACTVRYVENFVDALYLAVSVPRSPMPKAAIISVTYVGQHAHAPPQVCVCVCVYVCMYVCMCVYVFV
jgi:hypothetical protein